MQATPNDPLARAFEEELEIGGLGGDVIEWQRLTGGASRETYAAVVVGLSGVSGERTLIVQRERGSTQRREEGLAAEAAVVTAAGRAGMPVAEVLLCNGAEARTELGPSFLACTAVEGETLARRILRDDEFGSARAALPSDLGAGLARLHRADPSTFPHLVESDELANYRLVADELDLASPAFEAAFRWLENHRPTRRRTSVVHGDFRLGNLIVDQHGLAAVIDWELAHLGDPMEDLGWLCVRAWRFGSPLPVAGVGHFDRLFDAYEAAGGDPVDAGAVRWWQVLGSLKWGIMCAMQANHHRTGGYRSLELLAIGRRIPEQEHDVVSLIHELEAGHG